MSVQSPTPPPPGWGADALTSFLDLVRHQQFATYVNLRPQFDKILEVDNAFVALSTNVVDPEDLVGPFFSLQAHAAYRASASLAMSTQSSPTSRQKMKKEFTIGNLKKVIEAVDPDTGSIWSKLYERTIDYGAHPNPSALISALRKKEHDKGIRWEVSYLTKEPEVI